MIDTTRSLAAIRAALSPVTPDTAELDIDAATASATDELRQVAYSVAAFANALDDGTGFFNSSTVFGEQLADGFDEVRRRATVSGILRNLKPDELLFVIELALLQLNVATGPHAARRVLLDEGERASLQRISESVASTLFDAQMPADPEDEGP